MARATPNMALTVWNLGPDLFSYTALAANMDAIDDHDHTTGKGKQVPTGGISDSAITTAKIANNAVTTGKIADSQITSAKIADATIVTGDIADSAVTAPKIADGTITVGKLESSLAITAAPAPVSSLPGSPADGQEVYYQSTMDTADGFDFSGREQHVLGSTWHLRYRQATNNWESVGGSPWWGPPLYQFMDPDDLDAGPISMYQPATSQWGDPSNGSDGSVPSLFMVPLTGLYEVDAKARFDLTSTGGAQTGLGAYLAIGITKGWLAGPTHAAGGALGATNPEQNSAYLEPIPAGLSSYSIHLNAKFYCFLTGGHAAALRYNWQLNNTGGTYGLKVREVAVGLRPVYVTGP